MSAKFSIIIPVYNVAPYLRECLNSVLTQTCADWECICVDDGSTDGSAAILDEYAARDSRLVVVHKKNEGVSVARNVALDMARGEWITMVDADDWIERNYLERLLAAAVDSGLGLSAVCVRKVYDNGSSEVVGPGVDCAESAENLYVRYNSFCAWSCGKLYRRAEFAEVRYPVGMAYSEDRAILHQLLYARPKIAVVGEALYNYRINSGSVSAIWPAKRLQTAQALMMQIEYFHRHGFRRSELYSVGFYVRWVSGCLKRVTPRSESDRAMVEFARQGMDRLVKDCWLDFVRMARRERWEGFGSLAMVYENCPSVGFGRLPLWKRRVLHAWHLLRYDGLKTALRELAHK